MNETTNERKRNPSLHAHHRQRMKDKFLKYGLDVFSEHEVMELLLYYALPHVDTNEIAHELINRGGSFVGAFDLPYEEMKNVKGIKDQAATFLKLLPELARYYEVEEAKLFASPSMTYEQIAHLCVKSFIGIHEEVLMGFYFDSAMHLLSSNIINRGGISNVQTTLKEILASIRATGATNVVLAHNHPTVCVVPSTEDRDSTARLQRLFYQLDINLFEHFIVSGPSYMGVIKFFENPINWEEAVSK